MAAPLIAQDVYQIIMANKEVLDSAIIYDRDFKYDYFGFKTLERSYLYVNESKTHTVTFVRCSHCLGFFSDLFDTFLIFFIHSLKLHGKPAERPQHMLMRVAIGIHKVCSQHDLFY